MDIRVWGLSVGQLEGCDTQGPDVGFLIVPGLLDDLRSHPEWSAYKGVLLCHRGSKLSRNAKVR